VETNSPIQDKLGSLVNQSAALLIGIEAYENLGADQQLRAGRNDVLAFWKVCRRLGFTPTNIVLLTSPVLEVADLVEAEQELGSALSEYAGKTDEEIETMVMRWFPEGERSKVILAPATRENIEAGVGWLVQCPAGLPKGPFLGDRLLTYSGHGTTLEKDGQSILALCPSDVVAGDDETFLFVDAFKERLEAGPDNLTVVLDCCYAQDAEGKKPGAAMRATTLSTGASDVRLVMPDMKARVFCASGANEPAYQALLGANWHSAFSWAFTIALEQWQIVQGKGMTKHSTLSHLELLFRARVLLQSLSFSQCPVLLDKLANTAVFGNVIAQDTGPDQANRRKAQMDPGTKQVRIYTIVEQNNPENKWAKVIVPKVDGTKNSRSYSAGVEYWTNVTRSGNLTTALTISWEDYDWNEAPTLDSTNFVMLQGPAASAWSDIWAYPYGVINADYKVALYWFLSYGNEVWSGYVFWYHDTTENNVFNSGSEGIGSADLLPNASPWPAGPNGKYWGVYCYPGAVP